MRGLAVTEERYLVAGTLEPAGFVIFDLHAGGPPLWIAWPEEVPFAPYDMATVGVGGLCILDRKELRYWLLDRSFDAIRLDQERVETEQPHDFHFHPDGGATRLPVTPRTFPRGIALEAPAQSEQPNFDPGVS